MCFWWSDVNRWCSSADVTDADWSCAVISLIIFFFFHFNLINYNKLLCEIKVPIDHHEDDLEKDEKDHCARENEVVQILRSVVSVIRIHLCVKEDDENNRYQLDDCSHCIEINSRFLLFNPWKKCSEIFITEKYSFQCFLNPCKLWSLPTFLWDEVL